MNKKIYYIAPLLAAASLLTGCSADDEAIMAGEGKISLSASISGDVKVVSRADADELRAQYGSSLKVWLTKPGSGPVRQYEGIDNLPAQPVTIPSGAYVAEAWAGDSVSASFDKKYFKGYEPFDVTKGQTTPVNIKCRIANVVASVNYAPEVDEVMKPGYTMEVGHSRGTVTFEGRDARKGYFMMPSTDTDLKITITGEGLNGKAYTQTSTIANVKSGYEYRINVKASDTSLDPIGGSFLTITVDATEIDVNDDCVISLAPDIRGIGFDINQPQSAEMGKVGRKSVYITAAEAITSLIIESDELTGIIGYRDLDLITASNNEYATKLEQAGIVMQRIMTDGVLTNVRLNFEESYTSTLENGTHSFKLTASDGDKVSTATLVLDVTNAPVLNLPVNEAEVDYTSVTLHATILQQDGPAPAPSRAEEGNGFRYRQVGSGSWTFIAGTINGQEMTATVTGLENDTQYEYTTLYNGFETGALSFTTKAYPQLPNAGFEDWNTSGKAYLLYKDGQEMFWDSGNHGSTKLGAKYNITTPDGSIKHSGNYSVKLASQFVGLGSLGKFAAGNVFIGKYIRTDGMDGVLGWGREFKTPVKPKGLKGWVKYTPSSVTNSNANPGNLSNGDMDQGIIYIALVDNSTMTDENSGEVWPQIVKTKESERQLFDSNSSNVIAYGEVVYTEATAGDGMVEFTINLNDVNPNLTFTNIIIVASASRYGDYFTGGTGSTMWLDDLKLIY